ncbi:MAG: hypothetical protein M3137_04005 [Actinomycetota bacterium]|nr:hypothetical protein [Actinomycetota bacterium]
MSRSAAAIDFDCPRCHTMVTEAFYGPCQTCRRHLREAQSGDAREVLKAERFEPSMHVTPNAVALKDG